MPFDVGSFLRDHFLSVFLTTVTAVCASWFLFARDPKRFPPGPFAWPIVGNLLMVARTKDFYRLLKKLQNKYGNVFRLHLGQFTLIIICGHKNLSNVMVEDGKNVENRPEFYFQKTVLKERGILWANGNNWNNLRKLLITAQNEESVKSNFQRLLQHEVDALCGNFDSETAINPLDPFFTTTYNVVSMLAFGQRYSFDDIEFSDMHKSLKYIIDNSSGHKTEIFSWMSFFNKSQMKDSLTEHENVYSFLKTKLEEHKKGSTKKPSDLLDIYILHVYKGDNTITAKQLFQSIIDLYTAGLESYTVALMTCVFYFLKHPSVQEKCRKEIRNTIKEKYVHYTDFDKIPFFKGTLMEILRIAKPIVLSVYRTNKKTITIDNYDIPPNSNIIFDLMDPQVDPELWETPNEFNPDRWRATKHEGFIPFGCGPRTCICAPIADMTLCVLLGNMIKNYELKSDDINSLTFERKFSGIALYPQPFKMYLKPVIS